MFPAGAGFLKAFIQIEGNAGEVSEIFKKGKHGKENGHRRQHNADNPGKYVENSVDEQAGYPGRRRKAGETGPQPILYPEKRVGQKLGRIIGAGHGNPEDQGKKQNHDRDTDPFPSKNAVELPVPGTARVRAAYGFTADLLRAEDDTGNNAVPELFAEKPLLL